MKTVRTGFTVVLVTLSCHCFGSTLRSDTLGHFNVEQDQYLAHFDSKTDVDDIHSIAAVATMLADPRFARVSYHAVAGAYGTQGGLYVPANDLCEMAFGQNWSDAHADFDQALEEVAQIAAPVLKAGENIWIAEAGQSDFSAALCRQLKSMVPEADFERRFFVVQHADWNEEVTTPEDLAYLKKEASYQKIPDGNAKGNRTPGFRDDAVIDWRPHITDDRLLAIWERALAIANKYNGAEDRYLNESIMKGGLDFSDVAETAWIFGFADPEDADDFFREFASPRQGTIKPLARPGSMPLPYAP